MFLHRDCYRRHQHTSYAQQWRQNKAVNNRRGVQRACGQTGAITCVEGRQKKKLAAAEDGRLLALAASWLPHRTTWADETVAAIGEQRRGVWDTRVAPTCTPLTPVHREHIIDVKLTYINQLGTKLHIYMLDCRIFGWNNPQKLWICKYNYHHHHHHFFAHKTQT